MYDINVLNQRVSELAPLLTDVAMSRRAPEVYIRNARLVNVMTAEIIPDTCIGIIEDRIAWVGPDLLVPDRNTQVIDAQGDYVLPGLIDSHMHLESSMLTFREFSRAILRWGTTSVFPDPHEIANVSGLDGVFALIGESKQYPLRSFMLLPSCVPALTGSETSGATIDAQAYTTAIQHPDLWGMGEMMNFPGVAFNDPEVRAKIEATRATGKKLTGHLTAMDPHVANAYAASGVDSCHESVTTEQVLAKLRLGIYAMIREGSAWKDVKACIQPFIGTHLDTSGVLLVTDDVHADTLIQDGHINAVVNLAIAEGLDPVKAIQMATINAARYYGLADHIGILAPGRLADLVVCPDIQQIIPRQVFVGGQQVYTEGQDQEPEHAEYNWPARVKNSIRTPANLDPEMFQIPCPTQGCQSGELVRMTAIRIHESSAITDRVEVDVRCEKGLVLADPEQDLIYLTCIERYTGKGQHASALVQGFGFKRGAIAQSIAHDCHNIIVAGTRPEDMAFATQILVEQGGGIVVAEQGQILASIRLEIGGLMTTAPITAVAQALQEVESACRELGCKIQSPFMTLALVALPVIPHLRLTDQGLFDVDQFSFVDSWTGNLMKEK